MRYPSTIIAMKNKIILFAGAITAIALAFLMLSNTSATLQSKINRTELQRHDLNVPGREAVQVRIDFAPGSSFGKHKHPGEEIIYVTEGLLEYEIEGKPSLTLKAGEVLFIPAGTIHAAKNVGNTNAAELATYIVEKGKQLVVIVK
jgi:quercetin dioxygenase-like cupin family protein